MLIPSLKRSPMPNSKITPLPKHCVLLLAGLLLGVPTTVSAAPAPTQDRADSVDASSRTMTVNADGTESSSTPYLQLAKILVLKNEPDGESGIGGLSRQQVAPRLQSRIRKNAEFAAFMKLVQATSKRPFSEKEIFKLYLSYKEWSQKTGAQSQ